MEDEMKYSQEEKMTIEELRNLSKVNVNDVNSILKALMFIVLLNFSENESTKIPYFGERKIDYLGDKNEAEGRIADLRIDFKPSPKLAKNIGQLVDAKNPKCNVKITDIDCVQDIMREIVDELTNIMKKD
jgi:hypothetical protein